MARTIEEIYNDIVTELVANFALEGITITPSTWSKTNKIRLMCYSFAVATSINEQLLDVYQADLQAIQDKTPAASVLWLQDRGFKFQYSSTNPQLVEVLNGIAEYPVINETLRIINACSVYVVSPSVVSIKVAKESPLVPLSSTELTALQNYYNTIGSAGINYICASTDSDKIRIEGEIYFNSSYSAVISDNVINGINEYLLNLSRTRFGGDILLSDLKKMIRSIEGVNDITIERVSCRKNASAVLTDIDMVLGYDEKQRQYIMDAGYMVQETTASHTFADTLTFIPE